MTQKLLKPLVFSLVLTSCSGQVTPVQSYHQQYVEGLDPIQCEVKEKKYQSFEVCSNLTSEKDIYGWATPVIINNSKKVVLWFSDGPHRKTSLGLFNQPGVNSIYSNFLSTLNYFNVDFYLLHQTQWMKINKFNEITSFSQKDIDKENQETIDQAQKMILELKKAKRDVILGGQGFGAHLLNLYLAKYGTKDLVSAISFSGRVKPHEEIKKPFTKECEYYYYGKNDEVIEEGAIGKGTGQTSFCNFLKIGNGMFEDQRNKLANTNLSKTIFVSGHGAKFNGWLSSVEEQWLKQRNAKVKLFSQQQVGDLFDEYALEWGSQFFSDLGVDPKTFAHFVGWSNKKTIKEIFVTPFIEDEKKKK